jgi:hypothetical protein
MGWDDVQKKQPRFSPHAHDSQARVWAGEFNQLALDSRYEKQAAPLTKRRNGIYSGVDKSPGGFYGISTPEHKSIQVVVTGAAFYSIYRHLANKPKWKYDSALNGALVVSLAYYLANLT